MDSATSLTYKSLIKPIPAKSNLSNILGQSPSQTCKHCSLIVPDCSKSDNGLIRTDYERVDQYPEFPGLKASAKAGCELCKLFRRTIRSVWAARPMEEWGVGPLQEKEGLWDEMFAAPWDGKVKIQKVSFNLTADSTVNNEGKAKSIVSMGLEFGPATRFVSGDNTNGHGDIGRVINFKVFDSEGKLRI
jgi:hypothetical protein